MPEFLEKALSKSVPAGVDRDRYVYGAMNNMGAMQGSRETAKGREMERKHKADAVRRVKKAKEGRK